MNRILSISLLVLASLIAMQPALAFHFCSDKLASVEFLEMQEEGSVSCPGDHLPAQDAIEFSVEKSCCHTSVAQLSTDEYDRQDSGSQVPVIKSIDFLYIKDLVVSLLADGVISSQTPFAPPEHWFVTGRAILTRICVFII